MIEKEGQSHSCATRHYIVIDFCHFLRCFVSAKTLEMNVNDCLEISGKQMTKMAKKSETVNIKNHAKKI